MAYADLHIHSIYSSDGVFSIPNILNYAANYTDLSVISITDHDEIDGALEAVELAPDYGIEVIPGSEITSREGHIIALFIRERVPAGLSAVETILRVGEQSGICIAAHPMARGVHGISAAALMKALEEPEVARILVGVETYNAGLVLQRSNLAVQRLAESLPVARVGSSDSHVLFTIGQGVTEFSGESAADLRRALEARRTLSIKRDSIPVMRVLRTWLPFNIKRRVGWAGIH